MIESAVLFKTRQYNTTFWTDGYLKNSNHHHHQQNYPRPGSAGRRVAAGSEINVGPASAGYYKKHESSRKQVRLLQYFIFLVNFFPSPFVRLFKTHLFWLFQNLEGPGFTPATHLRPPCLNEFSICSILFHLFLQARSV